MRTASLLFERRFFLPVYGLVCLVCVIGGCGDGEIENLGEFTLSTPTDQGELRDQLRLELEEASNFDAGHFSIPSLQVENRADESNEVQLSLTVRQERNGCEDSSQSPATIGAKYELEPGKSTKDSFSSSLSTWCGSVLVVEAESSEAVTLTFEVRAWP